MVDRDYASVSHHLDVCMDCSHNSHYRASVCPFDVVDHMNCFASLDLYSLTSHPTPRSWSRMIVDVHAGCWETRQIAYKAQVVAPNLAGSVDAGAAVDIGIWIRPLHRMSRA